ncbi:MULTISPECIES: alkaline phosphatase family protein [unclassified Brevundimonas]|uniref:alkaline phosphatase family protein n=1 Tax=unclassified Brevundimonas TaxID=2622653 RepID=UPI001432082D|nr:MULTISPECIES: alkaline phosphatase family protein [unclassified Brevundimonas]
MGTTPAALSQPLSPGVEPHAAPALVVVVVVDQLGADLFNQYRPRFQAGLKTLSDEGLVYANGYHAHGLTETCPGFSTILSGRHPTETGIQANFGFDPETGRPFYCLEDRRNALAHGRNTDNGPVGPALLRATTLGDWLKEQSPASRVFAVSGKDRGAINLAGHRPDGAYWHTMDFGFTTYVEPGQDAAERLAPISAFNARTAERLRADPPAWDFTRDQCRALVGTLTVAGQAFHSTLPPAMFELDVSPLLDEITLEAATELLETQQLGRRGVTDLLGVSLSGTDRIGHAYGAQGPEMCEQMHRLDVALGDFLKRLEDVPGGVLLVLTADHGGSDIVERLAERGEPRARRADPTIIPRLNLMLRERFGFDHDAAAYSATGVSLRGPERTALTGATRDQAIAAAVAFLNDQPDVAIAVARDELIADPVPADTREPAALSLRERLRLSVVADRSPEIMYGLTPFTVRGGGRIGSSAMSHGSIWDYDRRVPILFWTPGDGGQERPAPIRTIDIAPTLANALGLETPEVDGRCIDLGLAVAGACGQGAP